MEDYKIGFRLFCSDGGMRECVNDQQRAGYSSAFELYNKLYFQSLVMEQRDIDIIVGMVIGS